MKNEDADKMIADERIALVRKKAQLHNISLEEADRRIPQVNEGAEKVYERNKAAGFPKGRPFIPNWEKMTEEQLASAMTKVTKEKRRGK